MVLSARRHAGPPAPAAPVTGGMGADSRVATAVNATMQISNAPDEARAAAGAGGPEAARGARRARVLLVDTSTTGQTGSGPVWDEVVEYTACADLPRWVRSVEQRCRLDFSLAHRAVRQARHVDLLLAGSGKVGIPLALMRPLRAVVCVVHQVASPLKRILLESLNISGRWSRVGYPCSADPDLLASNYEVPASRLAQFKAAPLEALQAARQDGGSYVLSLGTAFRDYATLLSALQGLSGVVTHLYVSS